MLYPTAYTWLTGSLTTSGTNTFTLTCRSAAGFSVSKTVNVSVAAAPTPAPTPVPSTAPTPTPAKTPTPAPGTTSTPTPAPGTTSTPKPAPGTTTAPVPGATKTPTSSTGGGSGSSGSGSGGGSGSTSQPAALDTTPPTAPGNLQALVSGSNAVIGLSWDTASDNVGISNYVVERSLDQQQWSVLVNNISNPKFTDSALAYDVTYFYRVKAADAAGNESGYATANGRTPAFVANNVGGPNASGDSNITYTSDDGKAKAVLSTSALDGEADCSVEHNGTQIDTVSLRVITGPYQLVCKNSAGDSISSLSSPIVWTLNLKNDLKGYSKPRADQLDSSSNTSAIKDAKYDKKSGTMTLSLASFDTVYVLAAKNKPFPWSIVVVIILLLAIVGAVFFFILRRTQKAGYDEYLRTKYYNL